MDFLDVLWYSVLVILDTIFSSDVRYEKNDKMVFFLLLLEWIFFIVSFVFTLAPSLSSQWPLCQKITIPRSPMESVIGGFR